MKILLALLFFTGVTVSAFLSPLSSVSESNDTDTYACTPVLSWTANVSMVAFCQRLRDRLFVDIRINITGTPTSAPLIITHPDSLQHDTAKMGSSTGTHNFIGFVSIRDAGVGKFLGFALEGGNATSVAVYVAKADGTYTTTNDPVTQAVPMTFANNDQIFIKYNVPIVGWGE